MYVHGWWYINTAQWLIIQRGWFHRGSCGETWDRPGSEGWGVFGGEKWAPFPVILSSACGPRTFFPPITQTICLLCSNYKPSSLKANVQRGAVMMETFITIYHIQQWNQTMNLCRGISISTSSKTTRWLLLHSESGLVGNGNMHLLRWTIIDL